MKFEIGIKDTAFGNIYFTGHSIIAKNEDHAKVEYLRCHGQNYEIGLIYANEVI